jgi:RNA polymerase sigma factor (sigma-70 family)
MPAAAAEPPLLAEEADWIGRCRAGETQAFRPLVERYQARLFQLCTKLLGRPSDAEEAVQEAFARAWDNLHRFDVARPFSAWLVEIAVNVCRDRRRGAWWRKVVLGESPVDVPADPAPGAEASLSKARTLRALEAALRELKPADREVLALVVEDLPAAEAARVLGISTNALYVRQHRARARLAELLRTRHPDLFDEE